MRAGSGIPALLSRRSLDGAGLAMDLPGGISIDGKLRRGFHFKPVTGLLELTLSESTLRAYSHPARVTAVLCETLEDLGGESPSSARVRELSVGDRQFLMRRLAVHIDDRLTWLTANCGECEEPFDISFLHSELPVKSASRDYPETVVETSQGSVLVRVPSGSDQEEIAAIQDVDQAARILLERLICQPESQELLGAGELNEADITTIETAAEAMAPEIALNLLAQCPYCATENQIPISPYACMEKPVGDLYREIHTLAAHYHWSEREILALPRHRRHTYLSLIDRSRGMNSTDHFIEAG